MWSMCEVTMTSGHRRGLGCLNKSEYALAIPLGPEGERTIKVCSLHLRRATDKLLADPARKGAVTLRGKRKGVKVSV